MTPKPDSSSAPAASEFLTTRWSLVLAASKAGRTPAGRTAPQQDHPPSVPAHVAALAKAHAAAAEQTHVAPGTGTALGAQDAQAALAQLCEIYWPPLYSYARRRGHSAADAADLTQGFFARLLEKDYLHDADPQRGRFRAFLLTAFQRFLSKEHRSENAAKRGGGVTMFSIDAISAESHCALMADSKETAEQRFERDWALALLNQALLKLESEFQQQGRSALFAAGRHCLTGDPVGRTYADIAHSLNMSIPALKVAVHRMRARYRDILRSEVAQTLENTAETDDELQRLIRAVSSRH